MSPGQYFGLAMLSAFAALIGLIGCRAVRAAWGRRPGAALGWGLLFLYLGAELASGLLPVLVGRQPWPGRAAKTPPQELLFRPTPDHLSIRTRH